MQKIAKLYLLAGLHALDLPFWIRWVLVLALLALVNSAVNHIYYEGN